VVKGSGGDEFNVWTLMMMIIMKMNVMISRMIMIIKKLILEIITFIFIIIIIINVQTLNSSPPLPLTT
jgi:hypothetical protein